MKQEEAIRWYLANKEEADKKLNLTPGRSVEAKTVYCNTCGKKYITVNINGDCQSCAKSKESRQVLRQGAAEADKRWWRQTAGGKREYACNTCGKWIKEGADCIYCAGVMKEKEIRNVIRTKTDGTREYACQKCGRWQREGTPCWFCTTQQQIKANRGVFDSTSISSAAVTQYATATVINSMGIWGSSPLEDYKWGQRVDENVDQYKQQIEDLKKQISLLRGEDVDGVELRPDILVSGRKFRAVEADTDGEIKEE